MTPDPRGFEDGPNLMPYVHNNPLLEIDLYGEYAYFEQAKHYTSRFGRAAFDFAFPGASAAYRLPAGSPLWQKSALTLWGGLEFGLTLNPLAKGAFTLGERAIIQVAKSAFSRQAERQMVRSAEKTAAVAAERQIAQRTAQTAANIEEKLVKNEVNQYTKSNLKLGQQMHKSYKADLHNPGLSLEKEFHLPSGRRIDFVDFNKGIIYELKPNNPKAILAGQRGCATTPVFL